MWRRHIFVAAPALFLKRALEHLLRPQRIGLSPTEAFEAMRSVGLTVLNIEGRRSVPASGGGRDARRLVNALQIQSLAPPQPSQQAQQE